MIAAVLKETSDIDKIPTGCNLKMGEVKFELTVEFNPWLK